MFSKVFSGCMGAVFAVVVLIGICVGLVVGVARLGEYGRQERERYEERQHLEADRK